jgi:hypothetical protein
MIKTTREEYRNWIGRLHRIAEEFRIRDHRKDIWARLCRYFGWWKKRPEDQCALRWSANIVAEKLRKEYPEDFS